MIRCLKKSGFDRLKLDFGPFFSFTPTHFLPSFEPRQAAFQPSKFKLIHYPMGRSIHSDPHIGLPCPVSSLSTRKFIRHRTVGYGCGVEIQHFWVRGGVFCEHANDLYRRCLWAWTGVQKPLIVLVGER